MISIENGKMVRDNGGKPIVFESLDSFREACKEVTNALDAEVFMKVAPDVDSLEILLEAHGKKVRTRSRGKTAISRLAEAFREDNNAEDLDALRQVARIHYAGEWQTIMGEEGEPPVEAAPEPSPPVEEPPEPAPAPPPEPAPAPPPEPPPAPPKAKKEPPKAKSKPAQKPGRKPKRDLKNPPFGFVTSRQGRKAADFYDPDLVRSCTNCGEEGTNDELFGPRIMNDGKLRFHQSQCMECRRASARRSAAKRAAKRKAKK